MLCVGRSAELALFILASAGDLRLIHGNAVKASLLSYLQHGSRGVGLPSLISERRHAVRTPRLLDVPAAAKNAEGVGRSREYLRATTETMSNEKNDEKTDDRSRQGIPRWTTGFRCSHCGDPGHKSCDCSQRLVGPNECPT